MSFRFALRTDVRIEDSNGSTAEYPPAWNVDGYVHSCIPKKSTHTHLYVRSSERTFRGIQRVVGAVSLYLDCTLGCYDAAAEENAEICRMRRISDSLRASRTFVWDFVRARTSDNVRIYL